MPTGIRSMPVLPSRDVGAAIAFWQDKLGFQLANKWGDEGQIQFAIMQSGRITVALQHIDGFAAGDGWSAYLYVDDATGLAAQIKERGVTLEHELNETFYGIREFDLRTPDGHGIAFGQDLGPNSDAPGL